MASDASLASLIVAAITPLYRMGIVFRCVFVVAMASLWICTYLSIGESLLRKWLLVPRVENKAEYAGWMAILTAMYLGALLVVLSMGR